MQEEVESKAVNLVVRTTELSAKKILSAAMQFLKQIITTSRNIQTQKQSQKPSGKQTVKQLIGQNQGVSKIDISKTDLKGFEKYARKFGVDYAIYKDRSVSPAKYMCFFKAKDSDAMMTAFQSYSKEILRSPTKRPSLLKQLSHYKERVAAVPKKLPIKIRGKVR